MTSRFTISHLNRLVKEGKIQGYTLSPKKKGKGLPVIPKPSKEKAWIGKNLWLWCRERGCDLKTEYKFSDDRQFRFDWAIPLILVAVEYEGLFSEKSGHTTAVGYTKDTDKYALAQEHGWRVIRVTALNYKTVLEKLNRLHP